jgi:hypothetical protein
MLKRSSRFLKNFFSALGRCFLEGAVSDTPDVLCEGVGGVVALLITAAACACVVCLFYGFFQVAYELMFDPNAADVASRLAGISISPEKWM